MNEHARNLVALLGAIVFFICLLVLMEMAGSVFL